METNARYSSVMKIRKKLGGVETEGRGRSADRRPVHIPWREISQTVFSLSCLVTDPDVCGLVVPLYCLVFVCPVGELLLTCFRDVSLLILRYSSVDLCIKVSR